MAASIEPQGLAGAERAAAPTPSAGEAEGRRTRPASRPLTLRIALGVALLLVLANELVRLRATAALEEAQIGVAQTHELLATSEGLLAAVRAAESSERGHLLTQDPTFLTTYAAERAEVPALLDRLDVLTRREPSQQQRFQATQALVREKMQYGAHNIALARSGDIEGARDMVRSQAGFRLMERLQLGLAGMRTTELRLLAARELQWRRAARVNTFSALASGAADVVLLIGLYLLFQRHLRRRALHAAHLEDLLHRERHARSEADAARREAERANRVKDEFLATISHELRTPLTTVLGWAQMLRERPDDASLARGLAAIERNARAQARMVDDLVDLSLIAAGRLSLLMGEIDLREVVEETVVALRPSADTREQQLILAAEPREVVSVRGDRARVSQAVTKLVGNAIKFTGRGGAIDVRVELAGAEARVIVRDTGEGLAQEDIAAVFGDFRQADGSARRRYGGLGIGLAIARRIAELHGGTLCAESGGRGQGATFVLALPVKGPSHDPGA